MAPMDLAESAQYLRHHLALVGRTDPLVADAWSWRHVAGAWHGGFACVQSRAVRNRWPAALASMAART